ncbi:hypothetical protein INT47_004078 [Mucor saturninus]|uniref:Uncharacterized protein n=1 Tax=Mucor saturninus TaxID=64648 RepID=A0A8H7V652_9FUNG|nr:hypothetical protein INT47_004078 [Mucor saturninus]
MIKSKVNAGVNTENVIGRFALYDHVGSSKINLGATLSLLEPRWRTTNDFVPLDPDNNTTPGLWSPLFEYPVSSFFCGVSDRQFISVL